MCHMQQGICQISLKLIKYSHMCWLVEYQGVLWLGPYSDGWVKNRLDDMPTSINKFIRHLSHILKKRYSCLIYWLYGVSFDGCPAEMEISSDWFRRTWRYINFVGLQGFKHIIWPNRSQWTRQEHWSMGYVITCLWQTQLPVIVKYQVYLFSVNHRSL